MMRIKMGRVKKPPRQSTIKENERELDGCERGRRRRYLDLSTRFSLKSSRSAMILLLLALVVINDDAANAEL